MEPGNLHPQQAFQVILTNCILRTIAHTLLTFHFYIHLSNQTANILRSGIVIYYIPNPKNPKVCNRHLDIYYLPTQSCTFDVGSKIKSIHQQWGSFNMMELPIKASGDNGRPRRVRTQS